MADTTANIILNTTGGDAAASEIGKATAALQQVTSTSSAMQSNFQERFQHIGLQLFAAQALGSIGLAGETRQAVMLMNTAIIGAEAASGIASGGLTLLLTALIAVGAAVYEVIEKHKDYTDELIKTSDQSMKTAATTEDEIKVLKDYKTALGNLPPALQDVLNADEKLYQQQVKMTEQSNKDLIASINQRIEKEKESVSADQDAVNQLQKNTDALSKYLKPGMEGYTMLERDVQALSKAQATLGSDTTKLSGDQATLSKTIADQIQLLHGNAQGWQKNAQTATESINKVKAAQAAADAKFKSDSEHTMDEVAKYADKMYKQQEAGIEKLTKEWEDAGKEIGKDFAGAMDAMIISGESATQALTDMFKKMFEQILQEILEMIAELAIFEAMAGIGSGAVAAAGEKGIANLQSTAFGGIFSKNAIGGTQFADTPTLAMFGEGGPEMATFTPMSGGGTSSGGAGPGMGGGTQNNEINITIQGGMIDQQTLSKIGQYIVQTIRGQGQVAFT